MNMTVKVEGIKQLDGYLTALVKGELRFGIAKGLTDLADAARNDFVKDLPDKFTLRTQWWKPRGKYGFNVKMATKESQSAEIYTRAPWMNLQEQGGTRTGHGHRLAIPTKEVRRTKRELIVKSQKPAGLTKAFPIKLKSGKSMLAMRIGRGKNARLKFMYTLSQTAQIKPTLHFYGDIAEFVKRYQKKYLEAGIAYSLRTAK